MFLPAPKDVIFDLKFRNFGLFQCFDAVVFVMGRHLACKKLCTTNPKGSSEADLWGHPK